MRPILLSYLFPAACLGLAACQRPAALPPAPSPIQLEARAPDEYPGLHHVYPLSERIISGAEPHGEVAFERLSAMGVRTVLSVDGKVPDAETAARHGLRYVHVPIHYSGIEARERARILKVFRELEGPFYVHCFHGKHRGPTAAALGRLALDGVSRERARAEMRQWCGTSEKYSGLYAVITAGELPSAEETAALEWDFPAAQPLGGYRQAMVAIARHSDNLELLAACDWGPDPEHPDLDALNEAQKIADLLARSADLPGASTRAADFRGWASAAASSSRELVEHLRAGRAAEAEASLERLDGSCTACHGAYRNR